MLILYNTFMIKFNIIQGKEICYFEELPKLAGRFGASAAQTMPSINFRIHHHNAQTSAHGPQEVIVYN